MKILAIISLVFGLAAGGIMVYHLVETYPRIETRNQQSDDVSMGGQLDALDRAVERDLRDAMWMQIYATWVVGGIGVILGVIAGLKKQKLGWAGAALSGIAVLLSLSTEMANRMF